MYNLETNSVICYSTCMIIELFYTIHLLLLFDALLFLDTYLEYREEVRLAQFIADAGDRVLADPDQEGLVLQRVEARAHAGVDQR